MDLKEQLDALVRDLTKTMPAPVAKSYARRLISEFLNSCLDEIAEEVGKLRFEHFCDKLDSEECWRRDYNESLDKALEIIKRERGEV